MKKLSIMAILLLIIYIALNMIINVGKDTILMYEINGFDIKEEFSYKENNKYFFEVSTPNNIFKFQINYDFNKKDKVIKKLEYFKNEVYECILPIFKDDVLLSDIMCINNNITNYYHNIVGFDNKVDEFASKIKLYKLSNFTDNTSSISIENLDIYKDNLIKDHYIGITNYKGIYNISSNFNSTFYNITLFDKDVYNQKLGTFIDKYYIVADYNKEYEFNEFNIVDLVNLKTDKIISDTSISLDGYIQGVLNASVYLYDFDNKVQYEVNTKEKTVSKNNNIKYYNKGEFSTITPSDCNDLIKFIIDGVNEKSNEYVRIDKVESTGYYYLYKQNHDYYDVYRSNIKDNTNLTYLFKTTNVDNIFYIDNYIYYINNDTIQVYNDIFGVKKIVKYKELEFNKNIFFNVYLK